MKIAVIGCTGRMGIAVSKEVITSKNVNLSGGTVRTNNQLIKQDIGVIAGLDPINIKPTTDFKSLIEKSDAVIDFSTPKNTLESLEIVANTNKELVYVIGTTGFSEKETTQLKNYAKKIPLIWSANMSVGVNILLKITEQVAQLLDEQFDIEIIEAHHRHKVDSPSGTALALGIAAAKGRNIDLNKNSIKSRDGIIGSRPCAKIGFSTIRGGDIVGEHTVMFAGEGERVELTHKASNRNIFAKGAVRAASWGYKNKISAGLYDMADVLFSNK